MMYGKQLLERLKTESNTDENEYLMEKSRGTVTGTAVGALLGLFIGYKKKQSLVVSAFIGGLIGGLASRVLLNNKSKKQDDE